MIIEPPLSTDPDVNELFDSVTRHLQAAFGYSAERASALAREYYRCFQDPAFCKSLGVGVQDEDFFFHEAALGVALRIQYYLGLKGDPAERKFLEWRKECQRQLWDRGYSPRA
jgi:hypothetical protein